MITGIRRWSADGQPGGGTCGHTHTELTRNPRIAGRSPAEDGGQQNHPPDQKDHDVNDDTGGHRTADSGVR